MENEVKGAVSTTESSPVVNPEMNQVQLESTGEMGSSAPNGNMERKKKAPIGLIVIIGLFVIAGVCGLFAYKYFTENPTGIVRKVINRAYEDFSKELKTVEKSDFELDLLNDAFDISGELKFVDKNYEGMDAEKVEFAVTLDYAKEMAEVQAGILKNGSRIADGTIYYQKDHAYLQSGTLFDNLYDMGEYAFDSMFDLSGLEDMDASYDSTVDDLDYIVRELKDALLDSLDERAMTMTKVNLDFYGRNVNANKITYKIDAKSYANLKEKLADSVIENDELVEKIATLFGQSESSIRKSFKDFKVSEVEDELGGEFSIYTTGIDYKVVRVELIDDEGECYVTMDDDRMNFLFDAEGYNFELAEVKTGETYEVVASMAGEEIAKFTIRSWDEEKIDFDYTITVDDIDVAGSVEMDIEAKGKNAVSVVTKLDVNGVFYGEDIDYEIEFNYDMNAKATLESVDETKALDEFTEADAEKFAGKMEELQSTALFQYFMGLFGGSDTDYDF